MIWMTRVISMLTIFVSIAGWGENQPTLSGNTVLAPEQLHFRLESFAADSSTYSCVHTLENPSSQDWFVRCENPNRSPRTFRVHLWLTQYSHPAPPQMSLELLYWVTDLSSPSQSQGRSHTTWFHLRDRTDVMAVSTSLGFDDETVGLYLDMNLAHTLKHEAR